jgi:hypothetical protein
MSPDSLSRPIRREGVGGPPGDPAAATNYRELYTSMATMSKGNQVNHQPAGIRAGLVALPYTIPMTREPGETSDSLHAPPCQRSSHHPIIPGDTTPWDGKYLGFGNDLRPGNQVLTWKTPLVLPKTIWSKLEILRLTTSL